MSAEINDPRSSAVDALYDKRNYPDMSHPVSDPALSAVAALIGGLRTPHPAQARVLEIGCGTGHNLIPLAQRWPEATFVGIDLSEEVVEIATRRAEEAGVRNILFLRGDLRDLGMEDGAFDYIIAHGFFSWVADDVKAGMLEFCAKHLSRSGIATISFNVWAGWEQRMPVIEAAKKIRDDHSCDEITALQVLRELIADEHIRWIIDDMLAKGADILCFDDFAPVNDAWPLDRFVTACTQAGLRWLGESDPSENIPSSLDDEARASLMGLVGDPLKMQMAADEMASTSFRSGVLCRHDAPVEPRVSTAIAFELSVRSAQEAPASQGKQLDRFLKAMQHFDPCCVPVMEVLEQVGICDAPLMARLVFNAITRGHLRPRIEPVRYVFELAPPFKLDPFRLLCAREKVPLVDAWHVGCAFPEKHYELLAAMDGTRSMAELELLSKHLCPELAFRPWLKHLAERGMFS